MDHRNTVWLSRRLFLSSVAMFTVTATSASFARSFSGSLPWTPLSSDPPMRVVPGGWQFFTPQEAALVEAIVDRLVPADDLSMGGKEAGCAVYIDRQLTGAFGTSSRLYTQGPFAPGLPTQGYQGEANPAQRYRTGLAAIDAFLKQRDGKTFAELQPAEQDAFLTAMEAGKVELPDGVKAAGFFGLLLQNTMEGFFADPVYGGNKDMVSWRMLGFPGARYDYRDHVSKHNQPYPRPPVSIEGSPEWFTKRS
ncbi:gluconate 2-dehydrogenase subunit 3 family protein [Mesorhizobium sp. B283B1A]|uniref:gluconate 2-dehydrogenase subunit 3 family protein n=1 Tax=Mesorhizobium TaxID=68287 RepID=UPI001CD16AB5|nr:MULTISPECIES: gluconate 2-dehydrogenase subunit 3 family protein [Mesorhizobium]MCA0047727.1 gluconate 2-dehydrogenase subunit 3 family protein [Mesorhizobium sp. B283B1A]UQS65973.1 gluconate 2-dehydrogenase subunit 3 family protein [Mesorhizobium opportunistum]